MKGWIEVDKYWFQVSHISVVGNSPSGRTFIVTPECEEDTPYLVDEKLEKVLNKIQEAI